MKVSEILVSVGQLLHSTYTVATQPYYLLGSNSPSLHSVKSLFWKFVELRRLFESVPNSRETLLETV